MRQEINKHLKILLLFQKQKNAKISCLRTQKAAAKKKALSDLKANTQLSFVNPCVASPELVNETIRS